MNLTTLHPYLITKADASSFTLLLEKLLDGLFSAPKGRDLASGGKDFIETLAEETSYELKKDIEKIMRVENIKIDNKTEQEIFLRKLKDEVSQLPIVHIMLAFLPKEDFLSTIQNWFYQNYKKTVLLEISIDESLIGGMVISFAGIAQDYSIKTQIAQMT